ncbi:tellurite resistance TerB family protein [Bacteroides sp. 519]|uniref:tellurite resistance TerB family protein n=1 Tax=Bacteroides sp. 519 TaxID=2302937 RepID=UPI0013D85D16|nr:tellurite resistance TerB family protein [Bacteroides sp. 519]NDV57858.1 tellurite resistance protein TerB [Bacteroides sp. 519]
MGLFDKVFKSSAPENVKLTQQESFAAIALAIAGADGCVAQSEWDGIVTYIRRLSIYDNFSGPAFDKLFDKLFTMLKKSGPAALVDAAKDGIGDDLKMTAFACAVDIALADGVLEEEEKDIINQLAEALEVPENMAISIIEVMMIKNKM